MNEILKIIGLALCVTILVVGLVYGVGYALTRLSTVQGSFVVIPETGQPFRVKKVTFLSNNCVAYEKADGTGGRISGNFRVEDAISQVLEKTQDK